MRLLCAFAAVVSVIGAVNAQSFTEGFEPGPATPGVAAIPAGWTSVNVSPGGPGTNPNWQVRNDGVVFPAATGSSYAFANFNSSTGANNINNYLISPFVTFNNGDTISFNTRTLTGPTFPDRLELVYNTTGSTNPVDFTNVLLTVNPTLTTTGYPTVWTQFSATITGLSGPTGGRFAFHYNPTNGGPAGSNSDYIGVDDVVYTGTAGGTPATNTSLGQGCYRRFASIYELFAIGGNDLANTGLLLAPNGSGGYDVVGLPGAFTPPGAGAAVVTLTDDSQAAVGTLGLSVGSNGWVALGAGNSNAFTPSAPVFLNNPSAATYFWHDMNPAGAGSGQVFYEEPTPTSAIVTYNGVFDFGSTTPNFIQYRIDTASGLINVDFGSLSTAGNGWLVGYSPAGASSDPGSIDLSASLPVSTSGSDIQALALTANTRPVTGTSWNLAVSNTRLLDLVVVGASDPNIADLFFLGAAGCGLRASLDLISIGSTFSLPIPNNPAFVGVNLFANGASLSTENAFGFVTSNGVQGTIGDV